MSDYLSPLLIDEDKIAKELIKRKKSYIEKTINGKNKKILEQKANIEAEEGWSILRKNKKSYRLKKDKPADEQLEDELWSIMAKMEFDELSEGRQFTVNVGKDVSPRQIDVFAKDRESAIFIECTRCETPKKKNMSSLIEKISSIHPQTARSVSTHYGRTPKLKVRWIIATRNIEWGEADLAKAAEKKIVVLRDQEIDYYKKLTDHLKKGAKYQFLGHIFAKEKISGLDITVPATKGKMGDKNFYNFLIKPADLMKIAYISHKASRDMEDLETYQRMLVPSRLKKISEYIDDGGQFPTNIVINIKSKSGVRFDKKEKIGESAFGILQLPDMYASAWVIDGQHRLYGYTHSKRFKSDENSTLPVLAYENLSPTQEAELFVDINCEQVKVSKSLLVELYANLNWEADKLEDRIAALRSRIVMALDQRKSSPIYGRIKTTSNDKSYYRCLSITSFHEGLKENKFFGDIKGETITPGPFIDKDIKYLEHTLNKSVEILSEYLSLFKNEIPAHWELGDAKGGYLCTNNGIRALMKVLKGIFWHLEKNEHLELYLMKPEEIIPYIKTYIEPVVDYFKNASKETMALFRSRQALKGVTNNSLRMMSFIHSEFGDFLPPNLEKYLETMDEEGTKEAQAKIDEIQNRLFNVILKVLKDNFKDDNEEWWYEGVPEPVRRECVKKQDQERGVKNKEQYICLIDYKTIASANWNLFKKYFSFTSDGGKDKQLKWLVDLNEIRNITHHTEKWPVTKEQADFVRGIHAKVMDQFTPSG
ncbi:MAG: DGQHR domain-containing protein [Desulfobacterales bacterium]|nr:DGQHR domain-containing protein [Desulfobacterales bacterium]